MDTKNRAICRWGSPSSRSRRHVALPAAFWCAAAVWLAGIATSLSIEHSRAQSPCPPHPDPADEVCPLFDEIECFCCGTCDTEFAEAGPCWNLLFIDGGNKCDPQGQDGGLSGADGTDVADFDGDGDLDVVTGFEEGGGVELFLNPCNPAPTALQGGCTTAGAVLAEWPKIRVDGGVSITSIEDASFGDLDGDCLADAVISSMEGSTDKVCIHYYIGPARRLSADILNVNNWRGECLPNQNKNYMRSRVGQIYPRTQASADNLPNSCSAVSPPECNDIVVGAKVDGDNDGETLLWYECPAGGATNPDKADQWVRHLIGRGEFFMSVELVDMDGDRDLDVLYSDRQRVGWFENPYESTSPMEALGLQRVRGEWLRHVIEGPGGLDGEIGPYPVSPDSRWLTQYDLDRDGDTDIITTVVYDMRECPDNSTFCTGGSHDNPGIRIVAHWYERRILPSPVRPTEGVSFALAPDLWLNYLRHIVAANDLPFRDEDTPEPPDEWVSKAVAAGDVMGSPHPELVFTSRGSGHGIYALLSTAPRSDFTTFERNHSGATQPLLGQIWTVQKISSAYLNLPDVTLAFDGRKMKYDNIQLVDLDHNGSLDVLSSEENAGSDSRGLGTVWYRNPCGDGFVDTALGEQCDLGGLNGNTDQCCTNKCTFRIGGVCPNDGNPCTDDVCQSGVCSHPAKANGLVCPGEDGNVCTQHQCVSGKCTPEPISDAPCDDDDACTQKDACQSGVCTGSDPVVCSALDQCHRAGTCDPETGLCTNPNMADGTQCNDDDACTQSDVCQWGVCTGSDPVVCSALDQCHDAGTCDPETGECDDPASPDGTACDDDDACTANDRCSSGACDDWDYPWTGFFQPVDNPGPAPYIYNRVRAGRAVAVRFSLGCSQGLEIFAAGYPKVTAVYCDSNNPVDEVESTVTAGNSSLTYDPVANQYTYIWKTDTRWAGSCRQLDVRLADGTSHYAFFIFP